MLLEPSAMGFFIERKADRMYSIILRKAAKDVNSTSSRGNQSGRNEF